MLFLLVENLATKFSLLIKPIKKQWIIILVEMDERGSTTQQTNSMSKN